MAGVHCGVPQGSVLGSMLFIAYTRNLFEVTENNLLCYADNANLLSIIPFLSLCQSVSESLNGNLPAIFLSWCKKRDKKLDVIQTKNISPVSSWALCINVLALNVWKAMICCKILD